MVEHNHVQTIGTGLSRRYAVAQPYPEGLEMDGDDKVGSDEAVAGCRVRHGELWNEDVKIHYVECGDKNGELVKIDGPSSLSPMPFGPAAAAAIRDRIVLGELDSQTFH